jgi:hypothetical protein
MREAQIRGWDQVTAADQAVVAKRTLKGEGAKGLACSGFKIKDNRKRDD